MVPLVVESWTWFGCVILVATSRFISRRMTLGAFKRFQLDDYVMLGVLCFYTTLIATINIVRYTNSNLFPPGYDTANLTTQDKDEREYGSKLVLVVEQCQCVTIWGVKACLLILYLRLTTLRKENIAIKILAAYVAFGFCFMEIFYFGVWCRPFDDYWAVPTPHVQCNAATNHLITNMTFNLSSDLIMLAIGLPMFLRMNLPWKKKIPVVGIFSLGIFVILAAILNKVYSFTEPFGAAWTYWYVRESSTALLVANLPFVWTFWRRVTGAHTVNGVSRQGSRTAGEVLKHPDRKGSKRKDSGPEFPWDVYGFEHNGSEVEMEDTSGSRGLRGVTLHEILEEGSTTDVSKEEVSPYTHPSLYFSKIRTFDRDLEKHTPLKKALVYDRNGHFTRRDSSPDERGTGTPASAEFPNSLNSQKSAGSFL